MDAEPSEKIDEIIFETTDKINAIVEEMKLIKFSKMNEKEKEIKFVELRKEFEKIMYLEERKVKEIIGNTL